MGKAVLLVTFDTEHEALSFANVCKRRRIDGRLIPIPRNLSAGCGMAWRSEMIWEEALTAVLTEHQGAIDGHLIRYERGK
ncbi:DUF3343 domain-containing protein [Vagococcus acidifermentans]|uniref:DUF3343 domain-containing protein n=1 Tax=Vagococcus acidifermentans TaxID=564710 RepID=UPI001476E8BE|nr:DUF3343 domain-containing protein [Vagococcus acidifermentans]